MSCVPLQPKNRTASDHKHLVSSRGAGVDFPNSETSFISGQPPSKAAAHESITFGRVKDGRRNLLIASEGSILKIQYFIVI